MNKTFLIFSIVAVNLFNNTLYSQNRTAPKSTIAKPKEQPKVAETKKIEEPISKEADYSKLSMRVSLGALPMAPSSVDLPNSSGKTGSLELLFNVSKRFFIGGYTTNMIHFESYDLALVDDKVLDLNSSWYNVFGLSLGFKVLNSKVVVISPELKGGLALYTAKSLSFPTDNKSFVDRKSLVLNPNLTIGFRLSEKFQLGVNGGYQLVMSTVKGPEMDYFNPSTLNYGLSAQVDF